MIGQKLGVGHLLEGSVRKEGKQLRITLSSSMSRRLRALVANL